MSRYGFIVDVDRCFGCYACALACRVATNARGEDSWCHVLQVESRDDERISWIPYVCAQARDPACGFKGDGAGAGGGGGQPPCVRACLAGALMYGDLEDPSSPVGRLIIEGRAKPMPHTAGAPGAYYVGDLPRGAELPPVEEVLPRKRTPT
ncbi:hypothetical protein [Conexivisphaera calida]|uniref:4Fe-4S ferredoxin-type domain-containing protein n=1 Tax=Conexivisphaera calida TaxID=1874277 RepID=A0A4P2VEX6_9ARCH|nr:hypothetical protein [Conexivisphaera calida]BBE42013.1 hypothetical protein NAS2_0624 [Conexivisphaera calida]